MFESMFQAHHIDPVSDILSAQGRCAGWEIQHVLGPVFRGEIVAQSSQRLGPNYAQF